MAGPDEERERAERQRRFEESAPSPRILKLALLAAAIIVIIALLIFFRARRAAPRSHSSGGIPHSRAQSRGIRGA